MVLPPVPPGAPPRGLHVSPVLLPANRWMDVLKPVSETELPDLKIEGNAKAVRPVPVPRLPVPSPHWVSGTMMAMVRTTPRLDTHRPGTLRASIEPRSCRFPTRTKVGGTGVPVAREVPRIPTFPVAREVPTEPVMGQRHPGSREAGAEGTPETVMTPREGARRRGAPSTRTRSSSGSSASSY